MSCWNNGFNVTEARQVRHSGSSLISTAYRYLSEVLVSSSGTIVTVYKRQQTLLIFVLQAYSTQSPTSHTKFPTVWLPLVPRPRLLFPSCRNFRPYSTPHLLKLSEVSLYQSPYDTPSVVYRKPIEVLKQPVTDRRPTTGQPIRQLSEVLLKLVIKCLLD